jgi:hypothetical protein
LPVGDPILVSGRFRCGLLCWIAKTTYPQQRAVASRSIRDTKVQLHVRLPPLALRSRLIVEIAIGANR